LRGNSGKEAETKKLTWRGKKGSMAQGGGKVRYSEKRLRMSKRGGIVANMKGMPC